MITNYKIMMMGARGVGKTSMLATMYDQFAQVADELRLDLLPSPTTSIKLQNNLKDLKSQTSNYIAIGGVKGTAEPYDFDFELFHENDSSDSKMNLTFKDIPGGWFSDSTKSLEIERYLGESEVILIAIDTTALMERKGKYNETVNETSNICNILKRFLKKTELPKLILFVPIKCESYVQSPKETKKITETIKEYYKPVFNAMARKEQAISTAIIPIQTIGNIRFNSYKERNGDTFASFVKFGTGQYAPQLVEQPLYYLLAFIVHQQRLIFEEIKDNDKLNLTKKEAGMKKRNFIIRIFEDIIGESETKRKEIEQIANNISNYESVLKLHEKSLEKVQEKIKDKLDKITIVQGRHLLGHDL